MPDGANAYPAYEQVAYESPMSVRHRAFFYPPFFFIFPR
jgi:hypothetical protein